MKNIFSIILLIGWLSIGAFAVCDGEPTMETTGKILKELTVNERRVKTAGVEIGLFIKASVKGASWRTKGAEAVVLTVFVDGKYNQDVILFAGAEIFEYQMLLGKFDSGAHRITIVLNEKRSAPNVSQVKIHAAHADSYENLSVSKPADRSISDYIATSNAPFIYARPNTIDKFTDIPLLLYYEIFDEPENVQRIRYSVIFSNEDGGTNSQALMARWGRVTDIEWIYEIRVDNNGKILSEIFQGANHETKNYKGARIFGSHAVFLTATENNNFADEGCSPLRFALKPVRADLSKNSRESLTEKFAWIYRVMAEEMKREEKIKNENPQGALIGDPRRYFYAEIHSEPENAAVSFEVQTADGKILSSDWNKEAMRVGRAGYSRIALFIPPEVPLKKIKFGSLRCHPVAEKSNGSCKNLALLKIVRLDEKFYPSGVFFNSEAKTVKVGERVDFNFPGK